MLSLKFLYKSPLGSLVTGWRKKSKGKQALSEVPDLGEDPARAAYVRSIPRAQWFGGVLLQGYLVHQDVLRGIEDFEVRDDDVFIITYPKSGTTWTEEIVSLIHHNGDPNAVRNKLLAYRVEHLEVGRPLGHLRHLRKLSSPRLMATHLPLPLIPKQLRQGKCKIIYVVRNPKDNAVSYYHHHRMSTFLGNFKGSWEEFLHLYMKGYLVYGSWFEHVLPYWKFSQEHPDRVLFISFEELKLDLPGMVSRIATFLGKPLSSAAIAAISNHCTFEQMKSNNMVNREVLPISDLFDMTQSKFMRKGIIGDWKNYFTEEQNLAFSKLYNEKMQSSHLELIFDPEEIDNRNNNGEIINTALNLEKPKQVMNVGNANNMNEHATLDKSKQIMNGNVNKVNEHATLEHSKQIMNGNVNKVNECATLEQSKQLMNGNVNELIEHATLEQSKQLMNGNVNKVNEQATLEKSKQLMNGNVNNMNEHAT